MGSSAVEGNGPGLRIDFIDHKPVGFNQAVRLCRTATFPFPLIFFAVQGVIMETLGQGLFIDDHTHYLNELVHTFAASLRERKFPLELVGTKGLKQSLTPQVRKQFFICSMVIVRQI
jgi:hypothetical protein